MSNSEEYSIQPSGASFHLPTITEDSRLRFQVELEFVQSLANPKYLNFLAQRGYFEKKEFVNYLKYLLYWKEAPYTKFIRYPFCLHYLELLQEEAFRRELVKPEFAQYIEDQTLLHWQHYMRLRLDLLHSANAQASVSNVPPASQATIGDSETLATPATNTNSHAVVPGSNGFEVKRSPS